MNRGHNKTFRPPSGENWGKSDKDYRMLPVVITETNGVTHVALWTDPTVRPAGVVDYVEDHADGLVSVTVFGPAKVLVGATPLQAGAHRSVCAAGAGASDAIKARIIPLATGNDYFSLGDFLESADVATGRPAEIFVNPGQAAVA